MKDEPVPDPDQPFDPSTPPYSILAAGYDVVMEHVEYEFWAQYVHRLLQAHHPDPQRVLELGCGTGTFALEMVHLGDYDYTATDRSPQMIHVAGAKARLHRAPIRCQVADFTDFSVEDPVDVVLLLYDGLNYLLEEDDVRALLRCSYDALRPGGLFVFDQSTPANSLNNEAFFEDRGGAEGFDYVRTSRYDPDSRLHTTTFDIHVEGRTFHERHVQRAYDLEEIRTLVAETRFDEVAAYDGFSTAPASTASERVHWILRKGRSLR